jgi:arylformamidase
VASMEIVDLSVAFAQGMPKFPAAWFPEFEIGEIQPTASRWPRRFTTLRLFAHNGTHIESSNHVMRDEATIDTVPLGKFVGFPVIVDLREMPEGAELRADLIRDRLPADVGPGRVVLLMTGYNDRRWGEGDFWERSPWLSVEAAEHIASLEPGLVGLDFQTERPRDGDCAVHRALVAGGAVLCEYLFNLERIDAATLFVAVPIKIDGVEASPVRAVGIRGVGAAV